MHPRRNAHAICCIVMGIVLAACRPGSPPTASLTPTGQTDAPSMPQSERATTTPIPTPTPHLDTVAAPTATLTPTPTPTQQISHPALLHTLNGNFIDMAFSPDGKTLATMELADDGSLKGIIRLWDAAVGEIRYTLEELVQYPGIGTGKPLRTERIRWSPDGSKLAVLSHHAVVLWDGTTGQHLQTLELTPDEFVEMGIAWSANRLLAVSSQPWYVHALENGASLTVWDVEAGQKLHTLSQRSWCAGITWSPYGAMMVSDSEDGFNLWNPTSGALMRKFQTFFEYPLVNDAAFSPDGTRLVTVGSIASIAPVVVWNVLTGEELYVLEGLSGKVNSAAFSPDGSMLVTGMTRGCGFAPSCAGENDDRVFGSIILWDAETGAYVNAIRNLPAWVASVTWSPAGDMLAARTGDVGYMPITLWSASAILSAPPSPMPTPAPTATSALMPDGKVEVEVYFNKPGGYRDEYVAVKRIVEPAASLPETVLREYFNGPSQEDKVAYGLTPYAEDNKDDMQFVGFDLLRIEDGIVYVHLRLAGDRHCTNSDSWYVIDVIEKNLFQFPEIRGVRLFVSDGNGGLKVGISCST